MPEQENTSLLTKRETRRDFLGDLGKLGTAVMAEGVAHHLVGLNITQAAMVEAEKTVEPQIDLPPGTYLTSQPEWFLKLVKRVPEDVLVQYNGPKSVWSMPELGGLFLVPSSYFGGKDGLDSLVKERLANQVIFRADVARDEKTDEGWGEVEQKLIQALLPLAARRSNEFFGQSKFTGFVRVSRPGKEKREALRQQLSEYENANGAVAGGSKPGTLQVSILTSFVEYAGQKTMEGVPIDQVSAGYTRLLKDLLCHEISHVLFLGTKLGSLDNHSIVRTAGASINLIDLLGKSPDEIRKIKNYSDLNRPEMLLWKAFKVKGREFYAELTEWLVSKYGEKTEYSDDEVRDLANAMFKSRAHFDFTYDQLLEAHGKIPDEKNAFYRSMEGYGYPIDKVSGDQYNPEGLVSWWEEVKSLAPVPFGTKDWANQPYQTFPDENGYYTVYHYKGNGRLKDGPPGKNSGAVATWMKGGSLTGGEMLFPLNMEGVEMIRAEKK